MMLSKPIGLKLAALAVALSTVSLASAQELSPEELAACQALLAELDAAAAPTPEQEGCIALLAQLGVQPAAAPISVDDDADIDPAAGSPS